jgi:hypothetical protein
MRMARSVLWQFVPRSERSASGVPLSAGERESVRRRLTTGAVKRGKGRTMRRFPPCAIRLSSLALQTSRFKPRASSFSETRHSPLARRQNRHNHGRGKDLRATSRPTNVCRRDMDGEAVSDQLSAVSDPPSAFRRQRSAVGSFAYGGSAFSRTGKNRGHAKSGTRAGHVATSRRRSPASLRRRPRRARSLPPHRPRPLDDGARREYACRRYQVPGIYQ